MIEREILQAIRNNVPFEGLPNVCVTNFQLEVTGQDGGFDAQFDIQYGPSKVRVYVEAKSAWTPKQVEQIAPWVARLKDRQQGATVALVCPALSRQSQELCLQRNVDFIDLAGNVFINVPGKMLLQRIGRKPRKEAQPSFYRNPFSGTSSRILRVLLQASQRWVSSDPRPVGMFDVNRSMVQAPKVWTLSEITEELAAESKRARCPSINFQVSFSQASRVLRSLEEELYVRRKEFGTLAPERYGLPSSDQRERSGSSDNNPELAGTRRSAILVPEPRRLLASWAQEYKDRFRWYLRRSFKIPNPFGPDLVSVKKGLDGFLKPECYVFTSAAATSVTAPFIDIDSIDLYTGDIAGADSLRTAIRGPAIGPDIRVIHPFDPGVFMYSSVREGIPIVSDIQAYLDLFARGGRDLKQADHLLQNRIEPQWEGN